MSPVHGDGLAESEPSVRAAPAPPAGEDALLRDLLRQLDLDGELLSHG